jgi:S1-C subfamily serine protease
MVDTADDGVRIKEADKAKPFALAGLRADDLVLALAGEAVKNTDAFRRQLRAKLAVGGEIVFTVRRGDKTVEVPVRYKE